MTEVSHDGGEGNRQSAATGQGSTDLAGEDRRAEGQGEGPHQGRGRTGRRTAPATDGRGRSADSADRCRRTGDVDRRLRRSVAADRLLLHVAQRPARGGAMRRLHFLHSRIATNYFGELFLTGQ